MEALLGVAGFLGFFVFLVLFIINAVKKKPKKKMGIGMAVCAVLFIGAFAATGSSDSKPAVKPEPTEKPKQVESITSSENESSTQEEDSLTQSDDPTNAETELSYNVDWDKCLDDLKDSVLNPEFFPYANDIYVTVDEAKKQITFSAIVGDATSPDTALDYADTLLRQFNLMANMQDSDIQLGSKDYYGGLYDKYSALIGVAPQSEVDNQDEWFVFCAITAGFHNKLKLQKVYK